MQDTLIYSLVAVYNLYIYCIAVVIKAVYYVVHNRDIIIDREISSYSGDAF